MNLKGFISISVMSLFLIGCSGATITNRAMVPVEGEKSITNYTCTVVYDRTKSRTFNLTDANVIAESLAAHLVQANLFSKVGLMMSDANTTLTAVVVSGTEPGCSFGSFPVDLTIDYELTGSNLSWKKTITTKTDSKLGCTTMFAGAQRAFHDEHLAITNNFALAVKDLAEYLKNQQGGGTKKK